MSVTLQVLQAVHTAYTHLSPDKSGLVYLNTSPRESSCEGAGPEKQSILCVGGGERECGTKTCEQVTWSSCVAVMLPVVAGIFLVA